MSTALQLLRDEFSECRTRRHRWSPVQDDGKRLRKFQASRTVERLKSRCDRCHGEKYEAWNNITGDILAPPAYVQPQGYSLRGEGYINKDIRKDYLRRLRAGSVAIF